MEIIGTRLFTGGETTSDAEMLVNKKDDISIDARNNNPQIIKGESSSHRLSHRRDEDESEEKHGGDGGELFNYSIFITCTHNVVSQYAEQCVTSSSYHSVYYQSVEI